MQKIHGQPTFLVKKMINNTFILTAIILSSSTFLLAEQKNQETPAEKRDRITITPLHAPELTDLNQNQSSPENINKANNSQQEDAPQKPKSRQLILPAEWILEASMESAPELLKGIFLYLQSRSHCIDESQHHMTIPSFHRFILVGPPGSGKTTLAHAIAHMLNYSIVIIPATGLLGRFKNDTSINIQNFLMRHSSEGLKKVIIIDELHKLFEHHDNDRSDDSQSAAAFWLALDDIEKRNPNIIFIGTANNVEKLPPEIKSRFSGKVITMPAPDKKQKIQAFKNRIAHDQSVILDESVNDFFITKMIQKLQNGSLRDVQLIIDTAKMFYYAEKARSHYTFPIALTRSHFQQALDQLQAESQVLQEKFSDKLCKKLQPWGVVFAIATNACSLVRASSGLYTTITNLIQANLMPSDNTSFHNNTTPETV